MTNSADQLPHRLPARRLRDLTGGQWLLLVEAFATLATASAAIAMLPFRKVVQIASRKRPAERPAGSRAGGISELRWALEAVAWRVPWRTVCFQKGLALHLMLRRRGIASILHYGVGKDEEGALAAHVWIDVDGRTIQGGDGANRFCRLASYPDGE